MIESLNVKVIGAGGIGRWLLPPLCTYINFLECQNIILTVIDGDSYEPGNRSRQMFLREGNKAEVTVEELGPRFEKIYFSSRPRFVTSQNVITLVKEEDFVLSCVDNHATRLLLSDRCASLDNVTLISGGNNIIDGNVQVSIRKNGVNLTRLVADPKYHPEIARPTDKNPGDAKVKEKEGCEVIAPSKPQLVVTNFAIASSMLNCFYACIENIVKYDEVFTDVVMNKSRPNRD